MTRVAPQQVAFAAGEISALLYGRPDYIRYRSGLKRCRGFIPLPEGVVTRAPGTQYMGRCASDDAARLIGFVFRNDDSYMLEFTPLLMRVWRNGALVMDGPDPFELVTPFTAESLPRLQTVQSADRVYIVDGLRAPQRLSRVDHDDWSIDVTPFIGGPVGAENADAAITIQASAATGAITLTGVGSPFAGISASGILRLDSVDQEQVPTWTGNTAASVGQRMAYDGKVYELVAYDGSGTTTGVNPPSHDEGDWLTSKDGPVWRFIHAGYGLVLLTSITNANAAAGTVIRALPADVVSSATHRWSPPAWGNTQGWPRAIGESDQRIIYGGTPSAPREVWGGRIGAPLDFERGIEADAAFAFTIAAGRNRQNEIRWIEEGASGLHIATSGGHVTARPTDAGLSIGPTTTAFLRGGRSGASGVLPAVIDGEPVYVSASGRKLRGLRYGLEDDRVRSDEISQNSRHILSPGVVEMAWQEEPWRILWFALDGGDLAGLTLYADQQVFAFHRHAICGGQVLSVAVKPNDDGTGEEVWLAVRRTVEEESRIYIERLAPLFFEEDLDDPAAADAWHQCAAVRKTGAAFTTVDGLGHLEGEDVVAWTDVGAQTGTVSGGEIELATAATSAITGLCPCDSQKLRTLPIAPQGPDGGQDGKPRRIRAVGARLLHTVGGVMRAIGIGEGGRETVDADVRLERAGPDPFAPVNLWSGVADYKPGSGWAEQVELEFLTAPGAPLTIAGLTPTIMIGDA